VFYIIDQALPFSILTPPEWKVVARDAFNGTVLWIRAIDHWHTPLWPLKSGPAQLPRRLVADGDRVFVTLGLNAPVSALDAATGETVRTYESTAGTEEILLADGVLYLLVNPREVDDGSETFGRGYNLRFWDELPRRIVAVQADSGACCGTRRAACCPARWLRTTNTWCFTMARAWSAWIGGTAGSVGGPNRSSGPMRSWRSTSRSWCCTRTSCCSREARRRANRPVPGIASDDTMTALSVEDGRVLWTAHHPPSGYRSPEDLLVVDGLVWTGETTSGRSRGVVHRPRSAHGRSEKRVRARRGHVLVPPPLLPGQGDVQLPADVADGDRAGRSGQQNWLPHHWVRGACLYGIMPANGLIYAPQHPCACYLEAKLDGFNALATAGDAAVRRAAVMQRVRYASGARPRLRQHSPVAIPGRIGGPVADVPSRCSAQRHGPAPACPPADASLAGGHRRAVDQSRDRRRPAVRRLGRPAHGHALDALTGQALWRFTTGAVDSPPTIHRGLALFGSADGYVYAVGRLTVSWPGGSAPLRWTNG
jgi:hypothetical protein